MPIIVQLYVISTFVYIVLSRSYHEILSDKFLRKVILLLVYAGVLRVALGLDLPLPFYLQASVFGAYALFVPGAYLSVRNAVYGRHLTRKDLLHLVPFLTFVTASLLAMEWNRYLQQEIAQNWSFTTDSAAESKILMPLFLFIYCLTAFYFYHFLLLMKHVMLKKETPVQPVPAMSLPVNENAAESTAVQQDAQHQALVISPEKVVEFEKVVREVLSEKKPYLQQRYSLKDLANDTNISLHHLSAFINKNLGKNFNDFINEYRVNYCREKIIAEEYKYKKLEAIAEESGFNNRNTFAIAFKKVTGVKPSEYLRNLKAVERESSEPFGRANVPDLSPHHLITV